MLNSLMTLRSANKRRGITLVELLVGFAILGILASLTLSGVQRVRELSRFNQCRENLRAVSLACHTFELKSGFIPSNGGPADDVQAELPAGLTSNPMTIEFATGRAYTWGFGDPRLDPRLQTGSWAYTLLPQIEAQHAWLTQDPAFQPESYRCPTRGNREPSRAAPDRNGHYDGGTLVWAKLDYAANGRAVRPRPIALKFRDIQKGLSNTVFVGEKAHNPIVQQPSSWLYDEPYFLGGSLGSVRSQPSLMQDANDDRYKRSWGSGHPALALFAMFDGSVDSVNLSIDSRVFDEMLNLRVD